MLINTRTQRFSELLQKPLWALDSIVKDTWHAAHRPVIDRAQVHCKRDVSRKSISSEKHTCRTPDRCSGDNRSGKLCTLPVTGGPSTCAARRLAAASTAGNRCISEFGASESYSGAWRDVAAICCPLLAEIGNCALIAAAAAVAAAAAAAVVQQRRRQRQ